jgi:hypothetical protein
MTSNGITITPSHSYSAGKATWGWMGDWEGWGGEGGWRGGAQMSRGGLKGAVRRKRIATHVKTRRGVGWLRAKVYAACSGGVVCLSLDIGKVWRIVPCVYKIYTLGRFQFHNLLRRKLVVRAAGSSILLFFI